MEFWTTFTLLLTTVATAKAGKPFLPKRVPWVGEQILSGYNATKGQFPFQVGIFTQKSDERCFCGGALIAPQYVLTAAGCCVGANNATVVLGTLEINNQNDPNRVEREVPKEGLTPHPNYNNSTFFNDICLIKLQTNVKYSDVIKPIKLPPNKSYNYGSGLATVPGWGYTSNEATTIGGFLKYFVTLIAPEVECVYAFALFSHNHHIQLCTVDFLPCSGDSGGPLIVIFDGVNIVVAISHFEYANRCQVAYPQVFTLVGPYVEWINANMV